jgi:hypothetical protein
MNEPLDTEIDQLSAPVNDSSSDREHHPSTRPGNLSSSVKYHLSSDGKHPSLSAEEQSCLDRVRLAPLGDALYLIKQSKITFSNIY